MHQPPAAAMETQLSPVAARGGLFFIPATPPSHSAVPGSLEVLHCLPSSLCPSCYEHRMQQLSKVAIGGRALPCQAISCMASLGEPLIVGEVLPYSLADCQQSQQSEHAEQGLLAANLQAFQG